jgi:hypothetical protein
MWQTTLHAWMSAYAVQMTFLNGLFTAFDELVELHGVYK